ncbi:hypothetical protein [Epilithonimonas caeni]|uniref:hypothetical protein n=1 Tax=Epilithonimonas caeni TaxID=365343 RepID=UPI000415508B|nr:hypothetical protein [Epilithonimonas caeni]
MSQKKYSEIENNTPPRKTAILEMLLKVDKDHPLVKKYNEQNDEYLKNLNNQISALEKKNSEKIILPELKPIDVESFYSRFLEAFEFFNGKKFDENVNDGECRKLARTLCAYLIGKKDFLRSPLLNRDVSEPSLNKGILMIGGKGIGKTTIMKTFKEMFLYASNPNYKPLTVQDIEGTHQILNRYIQRDKMSFGFHTANEVVDAYEAIEDSKEQENFNIKYSQGFRYFDDIMTEEVASRYGKRDIFRTIFEKRYSNHAKTMVSINYHDEQEGKQKNLEKTLTAFGNRYGDRVFDRSFEMYNIIELKGDSLRK